MLFCIGAQGGLLDQILEGIKGREGGGMIAMLFGLFGEIRYIFISFRAGYCSSTMKFGILCL